MLTITLIIMITIETVTTIAVTTITVTPITVTTDIQYNCYSSKCRNFTTVTLLNTKVATERQLLELLLLRFSITVATATVVRITVRWSCRVH
jgi:hypothetical protein